MSIHVGFFGPSLCGKTYAAKVSALARWRTMKRRALVLDLNSEHWGGHALVYTLPERIRNPPDGAIVTKAERDWGVAAVVNAFLAKMWAYRDLDVYIDEATETIGRDTDFTGVFTRGRHRGHVVYAMGHDATVLLPIQRAQFGTLYLFRQDPRAAAIWAREWSDDRILQATKMKKYQFVLCRKFAAADGDHEILPSIYPADYLTSSLPAQRPMKNVTGSAAGAVPRLT